MFSLLHTWDSYIGFINCNKDFAKGKKNQGKTAKDEYINLMDYGSTSLKAVLNECQRERVADQRRQYMTNDGGTNYRKLKGLG
ncbi:MAG TPA: hypothetical protein VF666_19720 [Pyrinomonadaceae bacterium]